MDHLSVHRSSQELMIVSATRGDFHSGKGTICDKSFFQVQNENQ